MTKWARMTALAGIAALALAACGSAPEDSTDSTSASADSSASTADSASTSAAAFKGCMVTDLGGVDDRSFNASAYDGLVKAQDELGVEPVLLESNAETDYAPNLEQLAGQDCGLIITVGFLLGGATGEAATANPDLNYAIIDSTPTDADGNSVELPNVKPLLFDTAQAAFLAGYVAAGVTKTGVVATYGGLQIPSVTVFMDGFADGVAYHNSEKGTSVQLLGWDKEAQNGVFAGGFDDQNQGRTIAETFISQQADIILPVAGPVGLGSAAAAQDAGTVKVIGVDTDWFESTDYGAIALTSVQKKIDEAVFDAISTTADDNFSADPYVGTLENGGVDIAPFHDLEGEVPAELQSEVDAIREKIISGEITVESQGSPSAG